MSGSGLPFCYKIDALYFDLQNKTVKLEATEWLFLYWNKSVGERVAQRELTSIGIM
jgi:hypothetical protein